MTEPTTANGKPGLTRPAPHEHAPYYCKYIELVPEGDLIAILGQQMEATLAVLDNVTEAQSLHRYAPGKWSLREALGHMIDTERIFAYRLLRIARGDQTPLPGFEQDDYVTNGNWDARPWADLLEEFSVVRRATACLIRGVQPAAWARMGTASGNGLSARAAAYVIAGHELHHMNVVRSLYLGER